MGSRRFKRTPLRSQVRIFGTDAHGQPFSRLAETVDVSPGGARLAGVFLNLAVGSKVDVLANHKEAQFSVVWRGRVGTLHAGEVALQAIDSSVILWPTDEPDWSDTFDAASAAPERRFYRRFECSFDAYLATEQGNVRRPARCVDLSFGGCYLEMIDPMPLEATLELSILTQVCPPLEAAGFVSSRHAGFGMGIRFTRVQEPKSLAAILDSLRKSEAPRPQRSASQPPPPPAETYVYPEVKDKTVLVVDDSLSVRGMIAQHLRRHGYSVTIAKDGEEALEAIRLRPPDLVLLDLLMPKLSGLAVLRRLKADPKTRDIPVLVISSLSEDNDSRLLAEGACGYVAKASTPPDQLPVLIDRTFQHIEGRP